MRPLQEERVREARARRSTAALEALAGKRPAPKDFAGALRRRDGGPVRLIAEVKKASPSAGSIREGDPLFFARAMAGGGAAAISVLTEERYFKGSLDDLARIAAGVPVPVMRKDFLVDPYQLLEARAAGASAALLIVAMLSDAELATMLREAAALGLAALVEVHDRPELERALAAGAGIVGINNRNLQTLKVDTETTYALRALVPAGTIVVSESGQRTRADLDRLAAAGVDAVLIGEAIMRAEDVEGKVRELLGHDGEPLSRGGDAEAAERRRHGRERRVTSRSRSAASRTWRTPAPRRTPAPTSWGSSSRPVRAASTRQVARGFWPELPRGVPTVAVFRDQTLEEVERVLRLVRPDFLQFHGCERPAFCRVFERPVIRALPARVPADLALADGLRRRRRVLPRRPAQGGRRHPPGGRRARGGATCRSRCCSPAA